MGALVFLMLLLPGGSLFGASDEEVRRAVRRAREDERERIRRALVDAGHFDE